MHERSMHLGGGVRRRAPDQPFVTTWPAVKAKVSFQPVIAVVPV